MHNGSNQEELSNTIALKIYSCYLSNKNYIDVVSIKNIFSTYLTKDQLTTELIKSIDSLLKTKIQDSQPAIDFNLTTFQDHIIDFLARGLVYFFQPLSREGKTVLLRDTADSISKMKEVSDSTLKLIAEIDKQIDRIENTNYGIPFLRDKKVVALHELKLSIATQKHFNLFEIIENWKQFPSVEGNKNNYELISTHRRAGFLSLFNAQRPLTQLFIDNVLASIDHKQKFRPRRSSI